MARSILIEPYVTEKMTRLMEEGRHYAFKVAKDANKIQIRKAIDRQRLEVGRCFYSWENRQFHATILFRKRVSFRKPVNGRKSVPDAVTVALA